MSEGARRSGGIEESSVALEGFRVFVRRVAGEGAPIVFVHGVPTSSTDWLPFLERTERAAIALDLPNFGRSDRVSPLLLDGGMDSYGAAIADLLDELGVAGYRLVVHDWGAVGLLAALRDPGRLERLVIVNAVPLLPGYRWHWVAQLWRRRGIGELLQATTTRPAMGLTMRLARPRLRPMPDGFVDELWPHWNRATRAAVLRLYRSAPPGALAAAGGRLGELGCPSLVVWGQEDPYLPPWIGRAYAARLPNAELLELDRAGHWPWLDRPETIKQITDFLA